MHMTGSGQGQRAGAAQARNLSTGSFSGKEVSRNLEVHIITRDVHPQQQCDFRSNPLLFLMHNSCGSLSVCTAFLAA